MQENNDVMLSAEAEFETVTELREAIVEQIEEISVEPIDEMVIDISEATGIVLGTNSVPTHTHEIEEISNLVDKLKKLGSASDTVYSQYSGFAEFRQWKTIGEEARFVSLVYQDEGNPITDGNVFIEVCSNKNKDVYGVTVGTSAFCGRQKEYCLLDEVVDKNKNWDYAQVCLLGVVSVRQGADYKNAKVGDYVVPDNEGCAIRSENGVGFRVVAKGKRTGAQDSHWNFDYVDIALVPQNDNVARVMSELEGTKQELGNLSIKIDKWDDEIHNPITGIDKVIDDLNGIVSSTQKQLGSAAEVAQKAQGISQQAKDAIDKAKEEYLKAITNAHTAINKTNESLSDLSKIKEELTYFKSYEDENTSGIVGFIDKVEKDGSTLATLNNKYGENGTEITLINQKIDANGAEIQHLVAHADKYSVGDYSLTHNLSYAEAFGLLDISEYIYVPTLEHTESSPIYTGIITTGISKGTECYLNINDVIYSFITQDDLDGNNQVLLTFNVKTKRLIVGDRAPVILSTPAEIKENVIQITLTSEMSQAFKRGYVYVWSKITDTNLYWWNQSDIKVFFGATPTQDLEEGCLWYSHNGIVDNNSVYIYAPRTLYRYNSTKKTWFPVARTNDSNARTISLINQTAEEISSTVTNLEGSVADITIKVDEISSKVSNSNSGMLSEINQTAQQVMMGVYKSDEGASTLELLLEGMQSNAHHSRHVCVGEFGGSPKPEFKKYVDAPIWTQDGFSFDGMPDATEGEYPAYYFDSDKTTYYCKQIDSDTYEIYTIGNQAMANISTRVNDAESSIESWTNFESELNQAITSITQKSNEDAAEMVSMVFGEYKHVTAVSDALTDTEKGVIGNRYDVAPTWNIKTGKFVFDESQNPTSNGLYCIPIGSDSSYYWELVLNSENQVTGYKKYEMKASNYASLMQKVDEDSGEISLVAGNSQVEGGIFVKAINDNTSATIIADRIALNGTTTFADALNPDKTAISGDYIKTGVITSNNYSGPVTYRMYGAKIETDGEGNNIITTSDNPKECIYYTPIVDGDFSCIEKEYAEYYASEIKLGARLFEAQQTGDVNKSEYIVCNKDFDLQPSNIETLGTKFDLNVGTIYSKNFSLDRYGNLTITGQITATSGYIGDATKGIGFTIDKSEIENEDGTKQNYYYIANDQVSLRGDQSGNQGVYLSPLGIGLGNGNFYVDNLGNVTMKGSIKLDGSISWGTSNSPVLVLYSASSSTIPTKSTYESADDATTTWHKKYQTSDYYASYSYDGGNTWTNAIRIQGKNGSNGSSPQLPSYIKSTYIDKTEIQSPTIYSGQYIVSPNNNLYDFIIYGELSDNIVPYLSISTTSINGSAGPTVTFQGNTGSSLSKLGSANWNFRATDFNTSALFNGDVYIGYFENSNTSALQYDNDMKSFTFSKDSKVYFNGASVTGLTVPAVFG